jgi:hypothetical protein
VAAQAAGVACGVVENVPDRVVGVEAEALGLVSDDHCPSLAVLGWEEGTKVVVVSARFVVPPA